MEPTVNPAEVPVRRTAHTPQSVRDEIALVAQRYAGYLVGHDYRVAQYGTLCDETPYEPTTVDPRPWREPTVVRDDCIFCRRLTDESAEARVAGFQQAMDVEVIRSHNDIRYTSWLYMGSEGIVDLIEGMLPGRKGVINSAANRRAFLESPEAADFCHHAAPLVDLPLRLKRKMCVEWNHVYTRWMASDPTVRYDFAQKEFFRMVLPSPFDGEEDGDYWGSDYFDGEEDGDYWGSD